MNPEEIAYWFFRLNGCLTIPNFIVHPDSAGGELTDADLIAVRFKHRCELPRAKHPMVDHEMFTDSNHWVSAWFVEVKTGKCKINGPWSKPSRRNLQRVLSAIGFLPRTEISKVARKLYDNRVYENDKLKISFAAVGSKRNNTPKMQNVTQLTWEPLLYWIADRFNKYKDQKSDHQQWDEAGKKLYELATQDHTKDYQNFIQTCLQNMNVTCADTLWNESMVQG